MKVDRSLISATGPANDTGEVTQPVRTSQAPRESATPAVQDKLELSFGVNDVRRAIELATPTRHVRPEAVARAQALMASGELGTDVNRLADRMLDSLIEDHG